MEHASQPLPVSSTLKGKYEKAVNNTAHSSDDADLEDNQPRSQKFEIAGDKSRSEYKDYIRWLYILDDYDKQFSRKIMEHSSPLADVVLGIWAHFFNRKQILISLALTWIICSQTYNTWLPKLGFQPIEKREVTGSEKFRLGACMFLTYGFGLIWLVTLA